MGCMFRFLHPLNRFSEGGSVDLLEAGGSVARTTETCRQCANHIPYIPRFSSFSWVSSLDAQDLEVG